MAFNSTPPRAEYVATSGQTAFPFLFKVYEETDIVVYQETSPSDPVLLLLTTDYTVTINGDAGGEITLVSGATLDDNITILRSLPVNRDVDYQTGGDLLADTLDMDQDYQTYLIADQVDRITALEAGDVAVSSFVLKTGDAMTGQLKGITPVDTNDITRKDYVDAADALKAPIASPTFTGTLTAPTIAGTTITQSGDDVLADSSKSLTANGYQVLSNGLIIQWGASGQLLTNSGIDITFPISFPTAALSLTPNGENATDSNDIQMSYRNLTTAGARISNGGASTAVDTGWIAIGY